MTMTWFLIPIINSGLARQRHTANWTRSKGRVLHRLPKLMATLWQLTFDSFFSWC